MKIKTVYINKEGAPMVSRTGWPEEHDFWSSNGGMTESFNKSGFQYEMDQAKRDAVPLEGFEAFSHAPGIILAADTFIDVDNEVEFFKQYRNISGIWVDVDFIDPYVQAQYQTRTIARVVPEKAENGAHGYTESAYDMPADEKKWRDEQHERDKAYYKDYDVLFATIANSLIKSGEDIPDANDIATAIIPDIESYVKQQLAAAKARIKELEEELDRFKNPMASTGVQEMRSERDRRLSG